MPRSTRRCRRVVVKGKTTVADIGAGTGFLGFLAARLGASASISTRRPILLPSPRKLLRHNRLSNCRIAEVHSTDVAEPDRVDVIVSETLGNYPFEENIVATLNDARERFLKPGGIIIPHAVEQFVCPVVGERLYRELAAWDEVGYGLDFAPAKAMRLNNIYVRWLAASRPARRRRRCQGLGPGHFDRKNKTTRSGEAAWKARTPATVYGLALWWTAELAEGVALSTGPLDPRTHWEQLYLPVLSRSCSQPGETLPPACNPPPRSRRAPTSRGRLSVADAKGRELQRQSLDLEKGFLP